MTSQTRRRSGAFIEEDASVQMDYNSSQRRNNNISLIAINSLKIFELKNFADEIRCKRDIQLFAHNFHLVLDVDEINLNSLIDKMMEQLIKDQSRDCIIEARKLLFAKDSFEILSNTMQGVYVLTDNNQNEYKFNQTWLCTFLSVSSLTKRKIAIARFKKPTNFGITNHFVKWFILILTPLDEKITKQSEEVCKTFGTLFADASFRHELLSVDEKQFTDAVMKRAEYLSNQLVCKEDSANETLEKQKRAKFKLSFGQGLLSDSQRYKLFISDFVDAFVGHKTIHKTIATTVFMYLSLVLLCVSFGVLDDKNTKGKIEARRALIGQTIGGLAFALFSGQPLVVIATTAPLCLYTKVVYDISIILEIDFYTIFACIGFWNSFYVILYSIFDLSYVMKFCTRSTEEIFSVFTFFAFTYDAIKDCFDNFVQFYCVPEEKTFHFSQSQNHTNETLHCAPENSILFLLLMLATLWLALYLYNLNMSPYLSSLKREFLADYAVPLSVLFFSFIGTYVFRLIDVEKFTFSGSYEFSTPNFTDLSLKAILVGAGLGFPLSLLFFMDQNISAALVNNPNNKLKKGNAYHLDLLVVAIINIFMSIFGLPWMNGFLPHSPLHARCLADVEKQSIDGHIQDVVIRVRENRVTGILANLLIGFSLFLIPEPLDYIPVPVLRGLFLYCAISALRDNSFYDRILLFVTEQSRYPPNHYIKRCPQKQIHSFTMIQIVQLVILCFFGFSPWPYVRMAFPVIIAIFIPIRWLIVPYLIPSKYLHSLDSYH